MATTDVVEKAAEALVAILDTAAAVVAVTGRASGNVVAVEALQDDTPLPVLTYQFVGLLPGFGTKDTRRLTFQVAAHAEGNGAQWDTSHLMEAVETSVTEPALAAQGLDACPDPESRPWPRNFFPREAEEGLRGLTQQTVDVTLLVTK